MMIPDSKGRLESAVTMLSQILKVGMHADTAYTRAQLLYFTE
jgi:hypothetical protein